MIGAKLKLTAEMKLTMEQNKLFMKVKGNILATNFKVVITAMVYCLLFLCCTSQISNNRSKNLLDFNKDTAQIFLGFESEVISDAKYENCKGLTVRSDNGSIIKRNGNYFVIPEFLGECEAVISCDNVEIDRLFFSVVSPTSFSWRFLTNGSDVIDTSRDTVKLESVTKFIGLEVISDLYPDIKTNIDISFFKLVLISSESQTESTSFNGNFTTEQLNLLSNLNKGDQIAIEDVSISHQKFKRKLPPRCYKVI
jgi:hypothetical protein